MNTVNTEYIDSVNHAAITRHKIAVVPTKHLCPPSENIENEQIK
jgi:hypothetical protein